MAHFGLGDAEAADVVRVEWPSGRVQELTQVAARQLLTVQETDLTIHAPGTVAVRGSDFVLLAKGAGFVGNYQWFLNDLPVPGETNSTLALTNIMPAQAGRYAVGLITSNGMARSTPLLLTVREPLAFDTATPGGVLVSNGWLQVQLSGVSTNSRLLVLEGSANLVRWYELYSNVITGNSARFIHGANQPGLFLRAKEKP